jgi:transposase-like protein
MNSPTKQRRPHFTAEERETWVSRFRSSGLTQPEFAREHGLKLGTLQRWLYGRDAHAAPKRKPPVPGPGDRSHRIDRTAVAIHRKPRRTPSATFQEIMLSPIGPAGAGWAAEVRWPSGVTVRLGAGAEASWIGALLGAVRRAC